MKKLQKGFTLVELMIVVAIIAILAAAALPAFGQQIKKSKDGKAVQLLGLMRTQFSTVQADLDGQPVNPADALKVVSAEVNTSVASYVDPSNTVDVLGINGYKKATHANAGNSTIAAGTPAAGITWTYSANSADATWSLSYSSTDDTKGKDWATY